MHLLFELFVHRSYLAPDVLYHIDSHQLFLQRGACVLIVVIVLIDQLIELINECQQFLHPHIDLPLVVVGAFASESNHIGDRGVKVHEVFAVE